MTDPWLPPAQQHPASYAAPAGRPHPAPAPGAPPVQPYPGPPVALPGPPPYVAVQRQGPSRTAVAGLVVGSVALLGVIGMSLSWFAPMFLSGMGGFEDMGMGTDMGEYELVGTLPQAQPGRQYSASEVVEEVEWRLDADWSTFRDLSCEPLSFAVDEETTCTGTVDGMDTDLLLRVDDEVGRYTLIQSW